jgi:hypothetical protein
VHRDFLKLPDLKLNPEFDRKIQYQLSKPQVEYVCLVCSAEIKLKPVENFLLKHLVDGLALAQGIQKEGAGQGGEDWAEFFG